MYLFKKKKKSLYTEERFRGITLDRCGIFSFYYLEMIGKREEKVYTTFVFLIFYIFQKSRWKQRQGQQICQWLCFR